MLSFDPGPFTFNVPESRKAPISFSGWLEHGFNFNDRYIIRMVDSGQLKNQSVLKGLMYAFTQLALKVVDLATNILRFPIILLGGHLFCGVKISNILEFLEISGKIFKSILIDSALLATFPFYLVANIIFRTFPGDNPDVNQLI